MPFYRRRRLGKYVDFHMKGNRVYMPMSKSPMIVAYKSRRSVIGRRLRRRRLNPYNTRKRARAHAEARQKIGETVGKSTAKRYTSVDFGPTQKDTRTLYDHEIVTNNFGDNIDDRQRNLVNVRGCKVMLEIRNQTTDHVYFHWAIVHQLNNDPPSTDNFFRGTGNDRGIDFSTALHSLDFHTRALNPDKFAILKHGRKQIGSGPSSTSYRDNTHDSLKLVTQYIPVNRQFRWDSQTATSPIDGRLFLIYWCDTANNAAGTASTANKLLISARVVLFFRDSF